MTNSKNQQVVYDDASAQDMLAAIRVELGRNVFGNKQVIESVRDFLDSRIIRGRDIDDKPFTALAQRTIEGKGFDVPLVKTGKMSNSTRISLQGDILFIENTQPYSGQHQEGTKTIPQRAFIGPPPSLTQLVLDEILSGKERKLSE